jgi:hypothetical protein
MDAPHIATAHFTLQYYLTVQTSPSGVDSPTGEGWYDAGTYASISTDQYVDIVPGSSRYNFTGWATTNMSEISDSSATSTTVYMDNAKTVTANYMTQYSVSFAAAPLGSGSTTPTGAGVWEDAGSLSISATANSGYAFSNWSSNTASITFASSSSSSTTAAIGGPGTITAQFALQYYTLTVIIVGNGSVTQSPLNATYVSGTVVTLTAVANAHWTFWNWTGDVNGTVIWHDKYGDIMLNQTNIVMNGNRTVTATFGLLGDLDRDGQVNLVDLGILALAWRSCPGDPNWNPLCDMAAPYNFISLSDVVTLAFNYGKHM